MFVARISQNTRMHCVVKCGVLSVTAEELMKGRTCTVRTACAVVASRMYTQTHIK
jgi:hypothetical protein